MAGVGEGLSERKLPVWKPTADSCVCHYSIKDAVVGIFPALGLQVKTLDLGLGDGGATHRYLLGRIIMELYSPRSRSGYGGKIWFFLCLFFLSLMMCVRGSPHHLVSVWPCVSLFIKRGESLFQGSLVPLYNPYNAPINITHNLLGSNQYNTCTLMSSKHCGPCYVEVSNLLVF
jgi:hypothetical protein